MCGELGSSRAHWAMISWLLLSCALDPCGPRAASAQCGAVRSIISATEYIEADSGMTRGLMRRALTVLLHAT